MKQEKLVNRYEKFITEHPQLASTKEDVKVTSGNTTQALLLLGWNKKELNRLVKLKHVIKAYTKNIFEPKEDELDKDGQSAWAEVPVIKYNEYVNERGYRRREKYVDKELKPRYRYYGNGREVRWILLRS